MMLILIQTAFAGLAAVNMAAGATPITIGAFVVCCFFVGMAVGQSR
jgi:hypothetical protein